MLPCHIANAGRDLSRTSLYSVLHLLLAACAALSDGKAAQRQAIIDEIHVELDDLERRRPDTNPLPHVRTASPDRLLVAYCTGPHGNGAARVVVRLAGLGRPVKIMVGGIDGGSELAVTG